MKPHSNSATPSSISYLPTGRPVILDVGSQDINGSLRACAPSRATYIGVDMVAGNGVDLLLEDPHVLPFADQHFDAVATTSCFEHDPMFWVTFLEITRVTRCGGYIYVCVPSNGWYHQHPRDNWRFYPDAGLTLQDWGRLRDLRSRWSNCSPADGNTTSGTISSWCFDGGRRRFYAAASATGFPK